MGMIIQNGKQYGPVYSELPPRKWLINPSVMQDAHDAPNKTPNTTGYTYIPYLHKTQNDRTNQYIRVNGRTTFNGISNTCVVQLYGSGVGAFAILDKINVGIYNKLVAYVETTTATYADWIKSYITLMTAPRFETNAQPDPNYVIRDIALSDMSLTAEQIMSQPGVKINITSNILVPAQYVEIDISGIAQDFYVCAWNCDRTLSFRSIYLE